MPLCVEQLLYDSNISYRRTHDRDIGFDLLEKDEQIINAAMRSAASARAIVIRRLPQLLGTGSVDQASSHRR